MAKKGQKFTRYTPEFKKEAVRLYVEEGLSFENVTKMLGLKSSTQVKQWVKKSREGQSFEDQRGKADSTAWRKGRPKTKFSSVEEELAYIKAENEYLKKRYPNLHGE